MKANRQISNPLTRSRGYRSIEERRNDPISCFQRNLNTLKSTEVERKAKQQEVEKEKRSLLSKLGTLQWKINFRTNKLTEIDNKLENAYSEMENDPEVIENSTDGNHPAVVSHGRIIERLEKEHTRLATEKIQFLKEAKELVDKINNLSKN